MSNADYRVVWVHGISDYKAGYSIPWEAAFNTYLNFPDSDYLEALWSPVFTGANRISLTPEEQFAADELHKALATTLLARATAQLPGVSALLGEWSTLTDKLALLPNPDDYIGEFTRYLASRTVRTAVKEKLKEKLRPLAASGDDISLISHSWGTIVAYESLLDLETELPTFTLRNLFTLGSPLWMVQLLLDDRSGRKPGNTSTWVNIHARGDLIGSWLRPGFQDDKDFAVPSFGTGNAHLSYFVPGNVAVQRDIVKVTILGPDAGSSKDTFLGGLKL
ncbi:MAG: hypothetical protein JO123_09330 [Ktedonobacteraceae bacterium]|nr:hypothetical protein [Ktedonobacteraceae bacterium]